LQASLRALRNIFAEYAPGYGRGIDIETRSIGSGDPQPRLEISDSDRLAELAFDPYLFAGIRSRYIGRLWLSASGIGDFAEKNEAYSPPQIIYPPYRQEDGDPEQLDFCRWQFDERLTSQGLRPIIDQIQDSYISKGRAIVEIDWQRETGDRYPKTVVINDLLVRDPERFIIDPKDLPPGIYLKQTTWSTTVTESNRLPDRKFAIWTNIPRFGSPYGVSEIAILDTIQRQLYNSIGFYARGLERSGVGALIGKYSKDMAGKSADAKARRAEFLSELQKLKSSTITMMFESCEVQELSNAIAESAFAEFINIAISCISLVLTGDPTALKETKMGTYAQSESKGVRTKGAFEQNDASLICDGFNYQVIPWLLDWNYSNITGYPIMQLIEPELVQPTISAEQQPLTVRPAPEEMLSEKSMESNEMDETEEAEETEEIETPETPKESVKEQEAQHFAESETPSILSGFPNRLPPPELYNDELVQDAAQKYLENMPSYTREAFDKLPNESKRKSFTITSMRSTESSLKRIETLKALLVTTIPVTNEAQAWRGYKTQAKQVLGEQEYWATESSLIASFRYARQAAYNAGLNALIIEQAPKLFGVQVKTLEDSRVRPSHRPLDGLLRKPDDPIWERLQFPLSFNCRCYRVPITPEQAQREKLTLTPDNELPNMDLIDVFEEANNG